MAAPKKYLSGAEKRKRKRARELAGVPTTAPAAEPEALAAPDFLAVYRAGDDAASIYDEAIGFLRVAMRLSVDADVARGAALERTSRIASALTKAADPKKQIEELGADLRLAARDIAELEERVRASRQPARDTAGPPGPAIN